MAGTTVIEVPADDPLCFFVRDGFWSEEMQKPRASAFKGDREHTYSTWHIELVHNCGSTMADLAIGPLSGSVQWQLTARDFVESASITVNPELAEIEPEYNQLAPGTLEIQVLFRDGDEHVDEEFRQWRSAHCQVEQNQAENFPNWYRTQLLKRGALINDA